MAIPNRTDSIHVVAAAMLAEVDGDYRAPYLTIVPMTREVLMAGATPHHL